LRPNINNILLMAINFRWTLKNFFVFALHFKKIFSILEWLI
jgi:hypothetical protein